MAHPLHIPLIKEVFQLAEPWTFTLWEEYRNVKLIKMVDPTYDDHGYPQNGKEKTWTVTLPAKFELKVERIYIRQNQADYNSVTFSCPYNMKNVRFWAKLDDVNKIVMLEPHERSE
jgi:hypothetical protein